MPLYQPPPQRPEFDALDPGLLGAICRGEARLTAEQGLDLLRRAPTATLGRWADARCQQVHGEHIRTYVIDRNINYTNVCTARCTFCAFRRDGDEHDAYTLEPEQIHEKIAELVAIGGTQILMQGGMNPALPLEWYVQLLAGIKERFPRVHVHAFSPPEFIEFVSFFDPPGATLREKLLQVMRPLREAGLDSLPGGGGEIFAPAVRRKIGLGKCDAEAWLTTMEVAHELGMFTSATMMFGHIEGYADRVHHMMLVRERQDAALGWESGKMADGMSGKVAEWQSGKVGPEAGADGVSAHSATLPLCHSATSSGHYKAFIAWPFQRENTPLGRVREWGSAEDVEKYGEEFPGDVVARLDGSGDKSAHPEFGRRLRMSGAVDYLRTQAVSRLLLDNIYSIGASWVTMGPHIGQVALKFGASDMGSVMMEENVVSSAGTTYCLNEPVLCRLIRDAGYTPAQRDNSYDLLRVHHGSESPDLQVTDWSEHRARRLHTERPREPAQAELTVGAS